ncbi:MAG: flagellar biosynthetic protein FliR [Spirochaetales bacterium]
MTVGELANNAPLFFLIFARVFALLQTAPLLSSEAIPAIGKVSLAFLVSMGIFPSVAAAGYPIPSYLLQYVLLLLGEALIGVLVGFFLSMIYSGFQLAGQYYAFQMGFGASEVFDPLAEIEIPIMGQFLNLIAMLMFLLVAGFQKIFRIGVYQSYKAFRAIDLVMQKDHIFPFLFQGMSRLFQQSLVISFPILGALFLVSITLGLFAKAAPQMNLLMMGFPISIGVAFLILFVSLPFLAELFSAIIDYSFQEVQRIWASPIR